MKDTANTCTENTNRFGVRDEGHSKHLTENRDHFAEGHSQHPHTENKDHVGVNAEGHSKHLHKDHNSF